MQEAGGEARIRVHPTGDWSGGTTPRGADGVCWAAAVAAAAAAGGREAATARPGKGEGSTEEGTGSSLEGQGPAGPQELSQDGLGNGGWTREGKGQHCWWLPPTPHRADLTCVPTAAAATAVGLGVPNTGAPAPLCRAARVLLLLWLSPRPSELAGRWRGREGPFGSHNPLP